MGDDNEQAEYGLVLPFWIDTDGYTDRDREMFVCGIEYHNIYQSLKDGEPIDQMIHTENASRIRMLCGKYGVKCTIETSECSEWSRLRIE